MTRAPRAWRSARRRSSYPCRRPSAGLASPGRTASRSTTPGRRCRKSAAWRRVARVNGAAVPGTGRAARLVDHRELGVEAVVRLVAADVAARPGVEDDRLADVTVLTAGPASTTMPRASLPGMCRVALSPRPNTGTGSPSAAKLVLKFGPEARMLTRTRPASLKAQARRCHFFQVDDLCRRPVPIAMHGQGEHAVREREPDIWLLSQHPFRWSFRARRVRSLWIESHALFSQAISRQTNFGGALCPRLPSHA